MSVPVYVLVLVAVKSLVCLGQEELSPETVPSCDASKFTFVDPDLEKLQGAWFKKYTTYVLPGLPDYDAVKVDFGYTTDDAGQVTLSQTVTKTVNNESVCVPDEYRTCIMVEGGRCENNDYGPDYQGILAIDYNSTLGSFIIWAMATAPDGQYPVVTIFVKDPYVFPTLDDVIARSQVKAFCDPGADDPSSNFYPIAYALEDVPNCLQAA